MSDSQAYSKAATEPPAAYHIELRQFPHNLCHFNLTEQELHTTIVGPWARERWIELGDRKWNPQQAKLTVLAGPHIPVEQLSMGRGWRVAQRQGHDVTEQVLAAGREGVDAEAGSLTASPGETQPSQPSHDDGVLADSLGLEFLTELGSGQMPLRRAWGLAAARHPERTAGQCLVLAERAVASLLQLRLIALVRADAPGPPSGTVSADAPGLPGGTADRTAADHAGTAQPLDEVEVQTVLRAIDSWTGEIFGLIRR
jgi:hypothetical protein